MEKEVNDLEVYDLVLVLTSQQFQIFQFFFFFFNSFHVNVDVRFCRIS